MRRHADPRARGRTEVSAQARHPAPEDLKSASRIRVTSLKIIKRLGSSFRSRARAGMLRGILTRHVLRNPTPRFKLHARSASSGRVAPVTASQARGRISRRALARWVPSLERTFSIPANAEAVFPACGRPTTPRAASSDETDMTALPKGIGAEALAAQSCAELGACSRCASARRRDAIFLALTPPTPRPPRAFEESRAQTKKHHHDAFVFSSSASERTD